MRPSSFFSVLAVTVSSLPTPPLGDLLGANAPDMVFRNRGSLLGPLLGGQDGGDNLLGGLLGDGGVGGLLGSLLGGRRGSGNVLGSLLGDDGVGGLLGSLLGGKHGNGNLLGSLLGGNDVGGLLGSLLGDNGVGNLLSSLLGEDGVGGLLDLLLGGQDREQPGSAEDQQNYFDREGTQNLTDDYTDLDAASRGPKASKGKTTNEAGASKIVTASTTSEDDSTPELIE
ncbi:hypothetical protein F5Y01DRAFT_327183 [Xylaria sp. FL0043]|nr:hypothetical protein F5Y01DRAFT_327183 [Xylaria sp. FL0043]